MGNKKGFPHSVDLGALEDADGSSDDDPYACMPSIKRPTSSIDGPPLDKWLARSYEDLPAAGIPLTRMISSGSRRY